MDGPKPASAAPRRNRRIISAAQEWTVAWQVATIPLVDHMMSMLAVSCEKCDV